MLSSIKLQIKQVLIICRALNINKAKLFYVLFSYYTLTLLNALLEGVGMVLFVSLFTGGVQGLESDGFISSIYKSISFFNIEPKLPDVVPFLLVIYLINFITRFSLTLFDGYLAATNRQKMQELVLKKYLYGTWEHMRNFKVGDAVGTTTQESVVVSKYLISYLSVFYFILSATITSCLALFTSFKISLALGVIALPLFFLVRLTFKYQAQFSKKSAMFRNIFSSNVTDRLNGLLQVHVDHQYDYHSKQALRTQNDLTKLDIKIGACQAIIGSFNLLLPIAALVGYLIFSFISREQMNTNLALVASVGILGVRVASQLNGAISAIGNLSRLSGSLYPVLSAIEIPSIPKREHVQEKIVEINLSKISYNYLEKSVLKDINLNIVKGEPLVLMGRSGSGKTTLANIIAGLYLPTSGKVEFLSADKQKYDSTTFTVNTGFVTQDIYLFNETLRSNLVSGRELSDQKIWEILKLVDATDFVTSLGGLDVESAEAGRSLSGGQRRRLGIARVLLKGSDVLIFDEITAGLDAVNVKLVLDVVEKLSRNFLVILISHDELNLTNQKVFHVE